MTAALIALACASCGSLTKAPTSCPLEEILPTMNRYVEGSVFIDTPWEPAPGTDLAAAIDAGGIACSYGIQEAEIGATILWAPGKTVFEDRRAQWQVDGQRKVRVPGTTEAWIREETNGAEQHLWALNILVDDVWIQINTTFIRSIEQAQPLVDATLAVVRN